jgi:hypothetical protein
MRQFFLLSAFEGSYAQDRGLQSLSNDRVFERTGTNADRLGDAIATLLRLVTSDHLSINTWENSGYRPTPTIIEATLALYRRHSVVDIANHEAGENLTVTSATVAQIVEHARANRRRPSVSSPVFPERARR